MKRIVATLTTVCAILAAGLIHAPQPASAASTFTLSWSLAASDKYIRSDEVVRVKTWSITPAAAPKPTASKAGTAPCTVKATTSSFSGVYFDVSPTRVTSGKSTQDCPVTLTGPTTWSPAPRTPRLVTRTYVVLSNEPIPQIDNNGVYCVASCKFTEGRPSQIWRLKSDGTCFIENYPPTYSPILTRDPGAYPVLCPHWINFATPTPKRENQTISVTATSSLGKIVRLTSATTSVCTVTSTNTFSSHSIKLASVSSDRTCTINAFSDGRNGIEADASTSRSFTVKNLVCSSASPCPKAQTITINMPPSMDEFSALTLNGSATSGLALTWEASGGCYINGNTVQARVVSAGDCVVTADQPGNSSWFEATPVSHTITLVCSKLHSCKPPVAEPDDFSFTYGDAITGNLTANDTIYTSGTKAEIVLNNAPGTVSIDAASGDFTFQPTSKYFVGSASFTYQLTDTIPQSSAAATVSFSVVAPPPPAPPLPDATLGVRAAAWMRLNTNEAITLLPTLSCGAASVQGAKCGTYASNGGIVGSYVEVTSMRVTGFNVTLPTGYPTSRYTLITNPTGDKPAANAFASGVTASVKFQQATASGATVSAKLAYTASYKTVTWTRYNGVLVETVVSSGKTLFANASAQFGVIGATS